MPGSRSHDPGRLRPLSRPRRDRPAWRRLGRSCGTPRLRLPWPSPARIDRGALAGATIPAATLKTKVIYLRLRPGLLSGVTAVRGSTGVPLYGPPGGAWRGPEARLDGRNNSPLQERAREGRDDRDGDGGEPERRSYHRAWRLHCLRQRECPPAVAAPCRACPAPAGHRPRGAVARTNPRGSVPSSSTHRGSGQQRARIAQRQTSRAPRAGQNARRPACRGRAVERAPALAHLASSTTAQLRVLPAFGVKGLAHVPAPSTRSTAR